jgi:hypothetical protein
MTEPQESLADLIRQRAEITSELMSIETSLGLKRRYDTDGREWTLREFDAWRRSAKYAKNIKLDALREIKAKIAAMPTAQNESNGTRSFELHTMNEHLENVVDLLREIRDLLAEEEPDVLPHVS